MNQHVPSPALIAQSRRYGEPSTGDAWVVPVELVLAAPVDPTSRLQALALGRIAKGKFPLASARVFVADGQFYGHVFFDSEPAGIAFPIAVFPLLDARGRGKLS